ncbi:MAG TPA: ferritin-like domain-containing protein [Polyangiaceae bacterium]|nr:ferritin-like domain-containing protein [Polyangiaceae bacterium]
MRLRTRVDVFGTALLSALGATQLVACGGSSSASGAAQAGTGSSTSSAGTSNGSSGQSGFGSTQGGAGTGANGSGGANNGGNSSGGASSGGYSSGGANNGGNSSGGAGPLGAAGSGNAGANATLSRFPCMNPKDLGDGFVQCDGYYKEHRTIKTCASHVPRAGVTGQYVCKEDTQCTDKPYGYCGPDPSSGEGSVCRYGCTTSADCATGEQCECDEPVGRCVLADCATDADCGSGFMCRNYQSGIGCSRGEYACQSSADTCGVDADCTTGRCGYDGTMHRFQCQERFCAVGRPFLVEGAERLAPSATRADWSELSALPHTLDLDAAQRASVAGQWTHIALMEHASIAAFARFTLQLLSLGAPASLIDSATAAMKDETKHAKACFALASHYAAVPVGPARLAIERSLDETSLEAIVLNTIREGCVGETVAAIEAREAAENAIDPALRSLLFEISADETRHAELAYRFVQWALLQGGAELTAAVQREFALLAGEAAPAPTLLNNEELALLEHGIVPAAMRQAIRGQAIAQVILPCSRVLTQKCHGNLAKSGGRFSRNASRPSTASGLP